MTALDEYEVSTDRERLDIDLVHRFLAEESYWATGVPRRVVEKAVRHSMCFAAYRGSQQVAFARVVTDYATYGYLMDVFVVADHRGRGLGKLLMSRIAAHPELQGFRLWQLGTLDAHGLYAQFGFTSPAHPERLLERRDAGAYTRAT